MATPSHHINDSQWFMSVVGEDHHYTDGQQTTCYWWDAPRQAGPTTFSPDYLEDNIISQGDLRVNPGYSQLLTEQYKKDSRRNPILADTLAGIFMETDTPPVPQQESNHRPSQTAPYSSVDPMDLNPSTMGTLSPSPFPLLHPESPPAPSPSTASTSTSYEKTHLCTYCGTAFDRFTRARDCRNTDLGLRPYQCLGRCGRIGCPISYGSEALLLEHLHPRNAQCPRCPRNLSKKNMARHQKEFCPGRNLPAGPSTTGAGE